MRCLWALALGTACGEAATDVPEVTLRDVSLVWPLPGGEETDLGEASFLLAQTEVGGGALLEQTVFAHVPPLTRVDEPAALYAGLTVVGARLDPCFQEGAGLPPCQPNLRLVLQPLVKGESGWEARDASVHAFYGARDADEIHETVRRLAEARIAAGAEGGGPLGIHPLLTDAEGRAAVNDALLPLLAPGRLTRVTAVDVHGGGAAWTFSGFDWKNGQPEHLHTGASGHSDEQHLLSTGTDALTASVEPPGSSADDFSLLLDEPRAQAATAEERQRAYDAAARVENPAFHNPGTLDCVSCHVSAMARNAASRSGTLEPSPDRYTGSGRHDLSPSGDFGDPRMVRALGYRLQQLVLSPRVIHESAAVADRVDAALRTE